MNSKEAILLLANRLGVRLGEELLTSGQPSPPASGTDFSLLGLALPYAELYDSSELTANRRTLQWFFKHSPTRTPRIKWPLRAKIWIVSLGQIPWDSGSLR